MRFPGKPMADIGGQPMIERVWRAAQQARLLDRVIVATDDDRIANHIVGLQGDVEITDPNLPSGTDRCYQAIVQRGWTPQVVVNIQGDEPLLHGSLIDQLVERILKGDCDVTTPIKQLSSPEEHITPSVVKVAVTATNRALYFTRAAIATNWKHIGLYAYTWPTLELHIKKAPSQLEEAEKLEQLRVLEAGARFQCVVTDAEMIAVDVPEDVARVLQHLPIMG